MIVQRFLPDDLFPAQQQARLRELMERLHEAVAIGEALAPQVQQELEELVEAELKATIERSARILKQTQREEK
ncbi:hypothetical protein H6F98_04300 [Microcoleus sp. FACHB-SPT15]|nr:hypothetical protein [Microcoleus sp. FACHB-SPT15]